MPSLRMASMLLASFASSAAAAALTASFSTCCAAPSLVASSARRLASVATERTSTILTAAASVLVRVSNRVCSGPRSVWSTSSVVSLASAVLAVVRAWPDWSRASLITDCSRSLRAVRSAAIWVDWSR